MKSLARQEVGNRTSEGEVGVEEARHSRFVQTEGNIEKFINDMLDCV